MKAPDVIQEESLLFFCVEPKSAKEIMEYFCYKNIKRFRRDYLKPLLECRKLEMVISDKPTSRYQKYKTIDKWILNQNGIVIDFRNRIVYKLEEMRKWAYGKEFSHCGISK